MDYMTCLNQHFLSLFILPSKTQQYLPHFPEKLQSALHVTIERCEQWKNCLERSLHALNSPNHTIQHMSKCYREQKLLMLCAVYTVPELWCSCFCPFRCIKLSVFLNLLCLITDLSNIILIERVADALQ